MRGVRLVHGQVGRPLRRVPGLGNTRPGRRVPIWLGPGAGVRAGPTYRGNRAGGRSVQPTGVDELDRALGGGLVQGAVVLLAGEPGVGKSTLLLEVAARWATTSGPALYVTGEESAAQVRLRAERTGALSAGLYLAAETDLAAVLGQIDQVRPSLLVLDSVQTVSRSDTDGAPGGVTQVREVAGALIRTAKNLGMATVLVGHVTKDGSIAGPRVLEHLVDVVLQFEGERHSRLRMVRTVKNRYGPSEEVGCFDLSDTGIASVADPTGLFLSRHEDAVPGTCVTVTLEAVGRCWPKSRRWWRSLRSRRPGERRVGWTPLGWQWCWPYSSAAAASPCRDVMSTPRRSAAPG